MMVLILPLYLNICHTATSTTHYTYLHNPRTTETAALFHLLLTPPGSPWVKPLADARDQPSPKHVPTARTSFFSYHHHYY
ncbi:uncharacterized protein B0T15DRAFT_538821 [Chaetomium strumarium]|uniref:Secreted protein n=1 Tax=Chaetomium strumarium TaxID=1170767 RepID=A0AAJ0GNK0_9PEZI|nr:hypothetical protein B0T15DRAFT_538821 [Chaetomium strumarium]